MEEALKEIPVPVDESEISVNLDDAGINIWIDKYADVFSGFDTRPLEKRKLSNDFITEICKMAKEEPTAQVELKFNVLDDAKDPEVEAIIIKHLHTHFTNKKRLEKESIKRTFRKGYLLTAGGFLLILSLAYVASIAKGAFFLNSLPVLTEPLAWFMTWTGLDHIFKNYGDNANMDINTKMLQAKISFFCLGQSTELAVEPVVQKPKKVIPAGNNLRVA